MTHQLQTLITAVNAHETWAILIYALVIVTGIAGICGYAAAQVTKKAERNCAELKRVAHSWDRHQD